MQHQCTTFNDDQPPSDLSYDLVGIVDIEATTTILPVLCGLDLAVGIFGVAIRFLLAIAQSYVNCCSATVIVSNHISFSASAPASVHMEGDWNFCTKLGENCL